MPDNFNNPGFLGGASAGFSRLAQAIGGGQGIYNQAADAEGAVIGRLALAAAQTRNADSDSRLRDAQAAQAAAETNVLNNRPAQFNELLAGASGMSVPDVQAYRQYVATGKNPLPITPGAAPTTPALIDSAAGSSDYGPSSSTPQQQQFDPAKVSKLTQAITQFAPLAFNQKDIAPENWAQALDIFRNQDLSNAVIAGTQDRNTVAGAQGAAAGKPMYHVDSNGLVGDQYTGTLNSTGQAIGAGNVGLIGAKTNSERALQTERYASAGAHNAQAAHFRAQTADLTNPPTSDDAIVDAIGQYKLAPPTGAALRNPRVVALMGAVASKYPDYDANQYAGRQVAFKAFSTGKDGQAVQSANTALNHLDTLKDLAAAQAQGNIPLFNQLANRYAAMTGQQAPTNLKAAITMVGPEISKAVIGAGGGVEDRKKVDDALASIVNGSPAQAAGTFATLQDLFGGRLMEASRTYQRTTGRKDFSDTFLSPAAQRVLAARSGATDPSASIPTAPGGLPPVSAIDAEIARRRGLR